MTGAHAVPRSDKAALTRWGRFALGHSLETGSGAGAGAGTECPSEVDRHGAANVAHGYGMMEGEYFRVVARQSAWSLRFRSQIEEGESDQRKK